MLKHDIAHIITASLVRNGDADGEGNVSVPFVTVTDIAEAAAEDSLNLIEDTQSRYYEERWEGE
jgi:hypothetical protein